MPKKPASREARAAAMIARMPHVPPAVAERMRRAFVEADFPGRGAPKAMEDFFGRLVRMGRPIECAADSDFRAVASSRTKLRRLLWALETFAPETPLVAATGVKQDWDRWLNSTYSAKPKKQRQSTRIAHPPEAWPPEWQAVVPRLKALVRSSGRNGFGHCV